MNFKTLREAEHLAKLKSRKGTFSWLNSGAEDDYTYKKNITDLEKIKIIPKILVKNQNLSLEQNFFSLNLKFPLLLSPMGHQTQFEKNGELSSAKGIHEQDVLGFLVPRKNCFEYLKSKLHSKIAWQIFPFGDKSDRKEIKVAEQFKSPAICFVLMHQLDHIDTWIE